VLENALRAAVAAPNHRMTEPWTFLCAGPETRIRIAEIAIRVKEAKAGKTYDAEARQALTRQFTTPAALVVVVQKVAADVSVDRENYAAIACALQNAALVLWEAGVGSKWSTGAVTTNPETYDLLKLQPEVARIVGLFWVGFPASVPPKPTRRRSLDDVVIHLA
jgi:nitroreductase